MREPSLDLHGMTVDEAIPLVDKFLREKYTPSGQVWIIHGKGTGVLRRAIRQHLSGHPNVRKIDTAEIYQGGDGVTRVDLKNAKT